MRLSDTATAPSEPKLIKKSMPFSVSVGPWNFNQRRLGCSRQATKSHARTAEHGHTGDGEAQIHYYYTQIYPTNAVSSKVVKVFFLFSLSSSAPRIILLVSLIQANVKNDISLTYKLPSNSFRLCALFFFLLSLFLHHTTLFKFCLIHPQLCFTWKFCFRFHSRRQSHSVLSITLLFDWFVVDSWFLLSRCTATRTRSTAVAGSHQHTTIVPQTRAR